MKPLKVLGISLLTSFLFLSLSLLGILFLISRTILTPDYITSELDNLDLATLTAEIINEQEGEEGLSPELALALTNTINDIEPELKEGISDTIVPVYAYLLGKSESLNLTAAVRENLVSPEVIASVFEEMDITPITLEIINEQLPEDIPKRFESLLTKVDVIAADLEPIIKEELIAAAAPALDFLLGESRSLSIAIPLESVMGNRKDTLRESFLKSPPAELAGLSPTRQEQLFDEYFEELTAMIPSSFELDEIIFPPELPVQIAEALEDTTKKLEQAKQYVGYFQLVYSILIAFLVLLIAGIILLNREVKSATRKIGITFITYGVLWFTGTLISKYFIGKQIAQLDIPSYLQELSPQLVNSFSAPLQWFSLSFLIGGIVLIAVSFIYPRWRQAES